MSIIPNVDYNGLHTISSNESVSFVRSYCKQHHLNVKLSGKGRTKQIIVNDINNEVNYWLNTINTIIIEDRNIQQQQPICDQEPSNYFIVIIALMILLPILIPIVLFEYDANSCQSLCEIFQSHPQTIATPNTSTPHPFFNKTSKPTTTDTDPHDDDDDDDHDDIDDTDDDDDKSGGQNQIPRAPTSPNNSDHAMVIGFNMYNKKGAITLKKVPIENGGGGGSLWHISYEDYNKNKTILWDEMNYIAMYNAESMINVLRGYFNFQDLSETDFAEWKISLKNDIVTQFQDMMDVDIYPPNPYREMNFYSKVATFSMDLEPDLFDFKFKLKMAVACNGRDKDTFYIFESKHASSNVDPKIASLLEKQLNLESTAENTRYLP